jgi:hypothetical protein
MYNKISSYEACKVQIKALKKVGDKITSQHIEAPDFNAGVHLVKQALPMPGGRCVVKTVVQGSLLKVGWKLDNVFYVTTWSFSIPVSQGALGKLALKIERLFKQDLAYDQ